MMSQLKNNITITNNILDLNTEVITVSTKLQSPLEMLFGQVVIAPSFVDAGQLSGERIEPVELWNNFGW